MIVTNTDLKRDDIVYERSNTWIAPDSGTTSGSRQTLVTGEACLRACKKLMEAKGEGMTLSDLKGQEFYGEYLAKTDPLGANVPNPVSHVAYGYATQMCILDRETGKIEKMVAAHDVGKAVNPLSCEGQIEGGVVMSMGFALRERYPIDNECKPIDKYGALGLFRSHESPEIKAIVVEKPGLKVAGGAIGIGEITSIPTAPAITDAYYRLDGKHRYSLPIKGTPYERGKTSVFGERGDSEQMVVDKEKCIGCSICARNCTGQAIEIVDKKAVIHKELCLGCGMCAVKCPKGAITDLKAAFVK